MSDDEDFEVEAPELAEDDPMRAFLPQSFGKKSKEADVAAQIDRTKRLKQAPVAIKNEGDEQIKSAQEPASKDYGSDDDDDSDDSDESDDDEFPVSHELVLKTHDRAVTT